MDVRARNRLIVAAVVLILFGALSAATSGVIRALTFLIAVVALIVALVVLATALYRLVQAGAGRVPSDGDEG